MDNFPVDVIIDTDIGDDIDDSFAISLAMQSPELHILGVTTVHNDTQRRAKMAARLLRLGGMGHVPVFAGRSRPICNTRVYDEPIDFSAKPRMYIDKYDDETYRTDMDAPAFIIKTLEEAKTPITIITLGALTNVAEVVTTRPDLLHKIARISMMGGAFFSLQFSEYNFSCDPEAADAVIQSGVPITCVGLDVTFQCVFGSEQLRVLQANAHPCIQMLMEMQTIWSHDVILHDPLAVAAVFDPSLITTRKICCRVECQGEFTRGMSVNLSAFNWNRPADDSSLEVAFEVDRERVVALCMERLMQFRPAEMDKAM